MLKLIGNGLTYSLEKPKDNAVFVRIYYCVPYSQGLVINPNHFPWCEEDDYPELPKLHEFLVWWHRNIFALVHTVVVDAKMSGIAEAFTWDNGSQELTTIH